MDLIGKVHHYPHLIKRWRVLAKKVGLRIRKFATMDGQPCYELSSGRDISECQLYLSAGIHGDEPAGTEGLYAWANKNWKILSKIPVLIYPCLNPWGLLENSRFTLEGKDLNRQWDKGEDASITEIIQKTLGAQFSLAVNLHEDYDANGIYLYEPPTGIKPDNLAAEILEAGSEHIPIDSRKKIEGRWARGGIIRPAPSSLPMEGLPEAAFLQEFRAERTFVFETPSELDLRVRVQAQVAMLDRAVTKLLF